MQAVILAAGEGTRMRPLSLITPKPLLKVLGKSLLDYIFEALPEEIDEVIIAVRYLGDQIRHHCGAEYYGRKVTYVEGPFPGSARDFLATRPYLRQERFLYIYGDELPNGEDVAACLRYPLSVLCFEVADPWNHGVPALRADGTIQEIVEKPAHPTTKLIANGVMTLSTKIFGYQPLQNSKGEYYFTSMLNQFVKDYPVQAVISQQAVGGISTPADIERVEKLL
jgi:bifunctional UDP-N-acetylglucosamine pyrophosphorylase/glucosamine-1-phosphate N-acetyltransferase